MTDVTVHIDGDPIVKVSNPAFGIDYEVGYEEVLGFVFVLSCNTTKEGSVFSFQERVHTHIRLTMIFGIIVITGKVKF